MMTLCLELSSPMGSIAICNDGVIVAERTWSENRKRNQSLFAELPRLLSEASVDMTNIERVVVGRGPGSYSGLRTAVTMAQSLALPGKKQAYAVSSAEALALQTVNNENVEAVAVVGDARRNSLWLGVLRKTQDAMETVVPWQLVQTDSLRDAVPHGSTLVTSDWERLSDMLNPLGDELQLIKESRFPTAEAVNDLARLAIRSGRESEPFTPIYLHPPV